MNGLSKWPRRVFSVFGWLNIAFAVCGLLSCVFLVCYIPRDLVIGTMSKYTQSLMAGGVCIVFILSGLAISGWRLIRGDRSVILLCNILFIFELLFIIPLILLQMNILPGPVNDFIGFLALVNLFMSFQAAVGYPAIALLALNFTKYKLSTIPCEDVDPALMASTGWDKYSMGIALLGWFKILSGLLAVGGMVYALRFYGYFLNFVDVGFLVYYFASFLVGFFLLKRKEWARQGALVLLAAGVLWGLSYQSGAGVGGALHQYKLKSQQTILMHQLAARDQLELLNSTNQPDYYPAERKKILNDLEITGKGGFNSPLLRAIPRLLFFLWFAVVFFFLTRPRTKELFTRDPDLGWGGRLFIRSLGILLITGMGSNLYWQKIQPQQSEFVHDGLKLMEQGQNGAAVQAFTKGIFIWPGNESLYVFRGIAYRNMGQWQNAARDYSRAIIFNSRNKEWFLRRGYAYEMMGSKKAAIADYGEALRLDPFYIQALINRGLIYGGLADYKRAYVDMALVVKYSPGNYDGRINLGWLYEQLERPLSAIGQFTKAIELDPHRPLAYVNRGKNYQDIAEYQKALDDFNRAIELDPRFADAYRKRASCWSLMKEYTRAAQDWDMAVEVSPGKPDLLYWRLYAYYRAGNMEKVKFYYEQSLAKGSTLIPTSGGIGFVEMIAVFHPDGVVKKFDLSRKVAYERSFRNGRLDGPARDYDEKGNLLNDFYYVDGLLNGVWKIYRDGRLVSEWPYKDDNVQGVVKEYYSDVRTKCDWVYVDHKAHGPYRCYTEDGKLEYSGSYRSGFKDGEFKTYHRNGPLWAVNRYYLGDLNGEQELYDEKGVKIAESQYNQGVQVGIVPFETPTH